MKEQKEKSPKLLIFLFGAILMLHGVLLFKNIVSNKDLISSLPKTKAKQQIRFISLPTEKAKTQKQIVNTEKTHQETPPKDQAFHGEVTQSTKKQTMAKTIDRFQKSQGENTKKQTKKNSAKKKVTLKDLAIGTLGDLRHSKLTGQAAKSKGASNNDYLPDIPLGDMTKLNTVQFKYYGFYYRIRQQLEQHWGHSVQQVSKQFYQQGRRIASNQNHITNVKVILNSQGEIIKVLVLGKSGVQELDSAAVEAFNQAGPFPNPPKGMIKQGQAVVEWGFVVKT